MRAASPIDRFSATTARAAFKLIAETKLAEACTAIVIPLKIAAPV